MTDISQHFIYVAELDKPTLQEIINEKLIPQGAD